MRSFLIAITLVLLLATPILAQPEGTAETTAAAETTQPAEPERRGHPVLFYLPNRLFDFLDFARARLRLGPGFAVSARATRPLSATAGVYASLFAGLPGPRGRPRIPWPVGMENFAGADVSVADVSTEGFEPGYGPAEVGAGAHLGILGFDFGLEPLETLDLLLGFIFIDFRHDDF